MRTAIPLLVLCVFLGLTASCRPQHSAAPPGTAEQPGLAAQSTATVAADAANGHGEQPVLPERAGMTPEAVVQAYYEWYIGIYSSARAHGAVMVDPVEQAGGYLTSDLVASIASDRAAQRLRADPMLCAQDVPRSVRVRETAIEGNRARVLVASSFEGHQFEVHLVGDGSGWQIDAVNCRPEADPAEPSAVATMNPVREDWVEYHNTEYGFRLELPSDWMLTELAQDPNAPPIGPANLRFMLLLNPTVSSDASEDEPQIPFSLELTIGDEVAYREAYGEPDKREEKQIGIYQGFKETVSLGEGFTLVRYVVQHPGFPERRVTILDPVSGVAERAAESIESLERLSEIVDSFRFVD